MRIGRSGSNRRISGFVPQTTPIGMPPATVLPYTTMSALTPKYSWAPPGARRKPVYTSSKMSGTRGLAADRAEATQPLGVALGAFLGSPDPARQEHRVARRGRVRMEGLHRVDQHRRDLARPPPDDVERRRIEVLEGEAVVEGPLAAETRLHPVPPAVIGAGEAHDELAAGVEARQPYRGHHRLGAAHVEGHLVEARDTPEQRDVLRGDRVQRAQDRTEVAHPLEAPGHPFLVAAEPGHVHAVGAAHVEGRVPVEGLKSTDRPTRSPPSRDRSAPA